MVGGDRSGREQRQLSWAEREFLSMLQSSAPDEDHLESFRPLPSSFWEVIVQATDAYVIEVQRPTGHLETIEWRNAWKRWEKDFTWHTGLGALKDHPWNEYQLLILEARSSSRMVPDEYLDSTGKVTAALRLSALEFLLDVAEPHPDFADALNERAEFFDVGLRLVGNRFVPTTSNAMHENVVRPTAAILADPRFAPAEALFREATARARAGDYPGAITSAWRSTEEALKCLGSSMELLAARAKANDGITPAVGELLNKLQALRYATETESPGGIDLDTAMFAIHVAGAMITFLAAKLG